MKKRIIANILAVVAIIVGLTLPSAVFGMQDKRLINSFDDISPDVLYFDEKSDKTLSIVDKLSIMSSTNTSFLGIGSGKHMTENEVRECARDFAERLNGLYIGAEDVPYVVEDSYVVATLVTSDGGAGESFICWNVSVTLRSGIFGFDVDDETGKVLKFTRITNGAVGIPGNDNIVAETVSFVGQMLGEYYGLKYVGIDYPYEDNSGRWFIRLGEGADRVLIQLLYNPYGTTIGDGYDIEITDDAEIIAN